MQHSELLLTTAEVSIAFAGFASLVTLLGRRSAEQTLLLDVARLRGMIFTSLLALAFSLFPFLPYTLGASNEAVWRISSGFFFVPGGALIWMQMRYLRQAGWSGAKSLYVNFPLALLILGLLAVNTLLDLGKLSAGIYVCCLFSCLLISGLLFSLAFLSFLSGRDD